MREVGRGVNVKGLCIWQVAPAWHPVRVVMVEKHFKYRQLGSFAQTLSPAKHKNKLCTALSPPYLTTPCSSTQSNPHKGREYVALPSCHHLLWHGRAAGEGP